MVTPAALMFAAYAVLLVATVALLWALRRATWLDDPPVGARGEERPARSAGRGAGVVRVLSLGGGTQSCALALMSAAGDLQKLDHIVFADTQGELPETYAYLDYLRPIVEKAGIPLHVVTAGSLEAALLTTKPTSSNPTPPAHVRNPDGSVGRIGAYRCSYDFKRRIIERHVKALCGKPGAWKRANVEQWIGFSLDEMKRMKSSDLCRCGHKRTTKKEGNHLLIHVTGSGCTRCSCESFDPWQVNRWPLIELRMKREDTIAWFTRNGHPAPSRSACWFCPNSGNDRWQTLRAEHPDLFERAAVLDETIRDGGGFNNRGNQPFNGELYLHGSLVPLRDADLRTAREVKRDAGVLSLFDDDALASDCEAEVCFT